MGTGEGNVPVGVAEGEGEEVGTGEGNVPVGVAEDIGTAEGELALVGVAIDGDTNEGELDGVGVATAAAEGELPFNGVAPVGDEAAVDGEVPFSGVAVVSGDDEVVDGEFSDDDDDDDGASMIVGVAVGVQREEGAVDGVAPTMDEGTAVGVAGVGALIEGELLLGVALELAADGDGTGGLPHVHTHLQSHVALLYVIPGIPS